MSLRIVLVAFAVFVATVILFCAFAFVTGLRPVDMVAVTIGPLPRDTAAVFPLHGDGGKFRAMKWYLLISGFGEIELVDPIDYYKSAPYVDLRPLPAEPPLPSVQWIDSPKLGVLTLATSQAWTLWRVGETNIRRPTWRSYLSFEGRSAAITLNKADAVPVSQAEALRLLGLPEKPAGKAE